MSANTAEVLDGPNDAEFQRKYELAMRALLRRVARARKDPGAFFELVFVEEFTRAPIKLLPHQRLFFDFVMAHPQCMVRAFAGSSKTYMVSALTLWLLGQDPTERGVLASATVGQAQKPMALIRRYIEDDGMLALVFPMLRRSQRPGDPWTQTKLVVERDKAIRDPSLTVAGIGAKLPGSRLSWLNADDLLTLENTVNEAQREHTYTWLNSTALTRLDMIGARFLVTNTPWFPTDLTYKLEKGHDGAEGWPSLTMDAHGDVIIRNTEWDSPLIRPALTEDVKKERHRLVAHDDPKYAAMVGINDAQPGWVDEGDQVPLWPEKFGVKELAAKRKSMPLTEYNRAYRCITRDSENARVKYEWIEACKKAAVTLNHADLKAQWGGENVYTGVDPAFGLSVKHDRSSIFTFAIVPGGYRRILDIQVGRWRTGEMLDRIVNTARRYGSIVCVEGNSAQRMIRDLVRERSLEVLIRARDTTGKNKMDPRFGLESIFMEVERGAWLIPNDPKTGRLPSGVEEWVQDLIEYEPDQHTGDVLMSSWIAREQARKMGAFAPDDLGGIGGWSSR